ncbi:ribosome biogenesis protein Nop16 [Talaromyces proteolyticus]|uniref:Nucleolar protein 16 n=1 Tax=Talaromyces proteolyticus TaxID=1131652 RepID=A0AAD4PWK6_9EURO|nr:ribosome biogenesis protein Nop16 [Talaromyces proteolyticus]KAH8692612.1 ribosome biogenesis protein Nop16 [Talaromyces proteolyticus]
MGREIQKKKNRSKVPTLKKKRKLTRYGDKKVNVFGNSLIAENWDMGQTLVQNYRRLGLTTRLNAPTGGVEKPKGVDAVTADRLTSDSLYITNKATEAQIEAEEVLVERDPETGKIVRVIADEDDDEIEIGGRKVKRSNPLSDPINDIGKNTKKKTKNDKPQSDFIKGLELRALQEEEAVKKRRPRQQSKREEEWIERLVARHGENVKAMVRDRKLNPMQQTEGDLRRRISKWQEKQCS